MDKKNHTMGPIKLPARIRENVFAHTACKRKDLARDVAGMKLSSVRLLVPPQPSIGLRMIACLARLQTEPLPTLFFLRSSHSENRSSPSQTEAIFPRLVTRTSHKKRTPTRQAHDPHFCLSLAACIKNVHQTVVNRTHPKRKAVL